MDKSQERYEALAEKWLNGTISAEEKEEFAMWYNNLPDTPMNIPAAFAASEEQHRNRMLAKITSRSRRKWMIPAAAAMVLLIGTGSLLVFRKMNFFRHPETAAARKILPACSNKAVLTLDDGRQVVLESLSSGNVMQQQGVIITKSDSSLLRYSGERAASSRNSTPGFNILTTPKGSIFRVELSDGTRVWINSATVLKYPTVFTGKTREVYLSGQAYFEVAQQKNQPFVVNSETVQVKVLGTSFDIMTYKDEDAVRTTLTEGAVSVLSNTSSVIIHPGQQAILEARGDRFRLTEPDLDEVLAWKDGKFRFSNANIQTVMRQVARWYDVTVEYRGDISRLNLTGSLSRKADVSELLKAFEKTGEVHFDIENKKIIVIPL
jgi:transmembrane sensor